MSTAKSSGGTFAPLAQPVFAVLWAATVLGNTGSFMRDVASSWLMTDLSASPAAVAMVQAAGTLPTLQRNSEKRASRRPVLPILRVEPPTL